MTLPPRPGAGGRRARPQRLAVAVALALPLALPLAARSAAAQPDGATLAYLSARAFALQGNADSALAAFRRAERLAAESGDLPLVTAAAIGRAEVMAVYRGCTDSAVTWLREAAAAQPTGVRTASDALVRLLLSRGQVDAARETLTRAYADVEGLGRAIKHETVHYLQGLAGVQRAAGQERAALATLEEALAIAERLHTGDVSDSTPRVPAGVHGDNFWLLYDLAQLRLHARSAAVRQAREGERIMTDLVRAGDDADRDVHGRFTESRLLERLVLKAHACTLRGERCPVPTPPRCRP